eukprot:6187926-Pleurochrysis_carterae.AAC.1
MAQAQKRLMEAYRHHRTPPNDLDVFKHNMGKPPAPTTTPACAPPERTGSRTQLPPKSKDNARQMSGSQPTRRRAAHARTGERPAEETELRPDGHCAHADRRDGAEGWRTRVRHRSGRRRKRVARMESSAATTHAA